MSNPIPSRVRRDVRKRDNDQCKRCGMFGPDIHHRKRRRDGGHGRANCIVLCRTCHHWTHAHPAEARSLGLIVSAHHTDPSTVPLQTFGGWVTLTDDGDELFDNSNNNHERPTNESDQT